MFFKSIIDQIKVGTSNLMIFSTTLKFNVVVPQLESGQNAMQKDAWRFVQMVYEPAGY